MPNLGDEGNSAMPARGQHEPGEHDQRQAPRAAGAGAVRRRAGPGHEQEEQHVVDGHDGADGQCDARRARRARGAGRRY